MLVNLLPLSVIELKGDFNLEINFNLTFLHKAEFEIHFFDQCLR